MVHLNLPTPKVQILKIGPSTRVAVDQFTRINGENVSPDLVIKFPTKTLFGVVFYYFEVKTTDTLLYVRAIIPLQWKDEAGDFINSGVLSADLGNSVIRPQLTDVAKAYTQFNAISNQIENELIELLVQAINQNLSGV